MADGLGDFFASKKKKAKKGTKNVNLNKAAPEEEQAPAPEKAEDAAPAAGEGDASPAGLKNLADIQSAAAAEAENKTKKQWGDAPEPKKSTSSAAASGPGAGPGAGPGSRFGGGPGAAMGRYAGNSGGQQQSFAAVQAAKRQAQNAERSYPELQSALGGKSTNIEIGVGSKKAAVTSTSNRFAGMGGKFGGGGDDSDDDSDADEAAAKTATVKIFAESKKQGQNINTHIEELTVKAKEMAGDRAVAAQEAEEARLVEQGMGIGRKSKADKEAEKAEKEQRKAEKKAEQLARKAEVEEKKTARKNKLLGAAAGDDDAFYGETAKKTGPLKRLFGSNPHGSKEGMQKAFCFESYDLESARAKYGMDEPDDEGRFDPEGLRKKRNLIVA